MIPIAISLVSLALCAASPAGMGAAFPSPPADAAPPGVAPDERADDPGASAPAAPAADQPDQPDQGGARGGGAVAACFGSVHLYGTGAPGSGGFVPLLTAAGCTDDGEMLAMDLVDGLGGAPAQIAVGLAPLNVPFLGGKLLVDPLMSMPVQLSGPAGAPGQGAASFSVLIPDNPSGTGTVLYMQAFVLDPGAAELGSLSRGLAVIMG
jgi:hypothetical protein